MAEATILIVDDEPVNLSMLTHLLRPTYTVRAAVSGEAALRAAATAPRPDLILLDIHMPGMDGWAVLARLQALPATQDIPVIFVTALAEASDEERGLHLGAQDYITKPIKPAVVLARLRTQLEAKRSRDWMRDQNAFLDAEVRRRTAETDQAQLVSIRALAHLAETRDDDSGRHIDRTQAYVHELALRLRAHPSFAAELTPDYIDLLTRSAPLHDIGKVGIPDAILLKPGKLTPEEWNTMKTHSRLGFEAIVKAEADADAEKSKAYARQPVKFLELAKEIALYHHEKWDGSGYPHGLAGRDIPTSARIMAIADVFDALISKRVYKSAFPLAEAQRIMVEGRAQHFDPDMLDAFIAGFEAFADIAKRLSDTGATGQAAPPPRVTPG